MKNINHNPKNFQTQKRNQKKSLIIFLTAIILLNFLTNFSLASNNFYKSFLQNYNSNYNSNNPYLEKLKKSEKFKKIKRICRKKKPYRKKPDNPYLNVKLKEYPTDDQEEERIHNEVLKFAKILAKKSNLAQKKISNGILPDNFPESVKNKAQIFRNNKANFSKLMRNPTKLWKFCINPYYRTNDISWCGNIYGARAAEKLNDCKNSFCNVCCDNLPQIFQHVNNKSPLGQSFMLNKSSGFRRIKRVIDNSQIENCRRECNTEYPMKKVIIMPIPPRFYDLGKSPSKSAKSCSDIKKWGDPNAKSGIYWIDLGLKGKTKGFCDMETDNGGWTLFFNYKYDYENKKFRRLLIDSAKLPENLESNSHVNLGDAGFENDDISELRFFCEENYPRKTFIHFKISNYNINQLAITGDQTKINPNHWKKNYNDLLPSRMMSKYNRALSAENIAEIDINSTSINGGFWNTPFGNSSKGLYWSVIGENKDLLRLECGRANRDIMSGDNVNVKTHHSVFFRGAPMSNDNARIRYINYTKLKK